MRGIAVELFALLVLQTLGASIFARFEVETPMYRRLLKWTIFVGVTAGLYFIVGHWALLFPITMMALGSSYHFIYCRREGIHPLYATPKRKYYKLRGWEWQE
jgi:hypothetical protein